MVASWTLLLQTQSHLLPPSDTNVYRKRTDERGHCHCSSPHRSSTCHHIGKGCLRFCAVHCHFHPNTHLSQATIRNCVGLCVRDSEVPTMELAYCRQNPGTRPLVTCIAREGLTCKLVSPDSDSIQTSVRGALQDTKICKSNGHTAEEYLSRVSFSPRVHLQARVTRRRLDRGTSPYQVVLKRLERP